MPLFSFEGLSPQVHPDAWIAPTATLIGDVVVEKDASVWFGAVIRADSARTPPSATSAWCTTARSASRP
jgi:carbonic anhydrase/acetyltransferase-like protein (isoleucine patch superfamily)